ncbi:DUF559 domain-containing protein [Gordonia sp. HY442]|uniref:type IV toxin-antitoxin system AbiEi family antitoxin domain-containing protein n=1 Tax=Gordonia zhenghanii TaxID=2911516 RepID=UPI001F17907A|nr:type IV toxin-antitoxin system AbiEi family antitoxin domain-containing protein [Gordonia zhenghanii]MCF8605779.1 DUF559 domain-containing protein [Gordonia zhenghanii]
MGDYGEIAVFLAAHDGVVDVRQAHACGLSDGDIRGRLKRGEWLALARGVYRSAAHPFTEAAVVRAAVLSYRGVADRTTAAWWHGMLRDLPLRISLSTPHRRTAPDWPIDVLATRRRYQHESVTDVLDLPVTRKPLTALMAAVDLPSGAQFLDRMLQKQTVTLDGLYRAIDDNVGLQGTVAARRLLAVAASDSEPDAERLFTRLLDDWSVAGWVQQYPIGGWRLDFAWPELKVGVEISGWAFHRDTARHGNDLAKANWLQRNGWSELQYNWHMLNDTPALCIQEVIDRLNARSIAADW